MVLHNPNNWHWVDKNVAPWARKWLDQNVIGIEAEDGSVKAKIDKIVSMEGDVDVSQRKGKVITIFDVKVVLEYSGSAPGQSQVSGTITVPEVAHDTDEDEYVFDIEIHAESKEKQPVKDLVRSKITPQLRAQFQKLAGALIKEHGKDIQHAPDSNPPPALSAPKVYPPTGAQAKSASASAASAGAASTAAAATVRTTTLDSEEEFRTTAEEMFVTFTDPQRIAAFTRAPPRKWEGAAKGAKFELFDGNVQGEFLELEHPTKIVQSWRLAQWPQGHFSQLQIEFVQNDSDGVTAMRVAWSGVPVGQEEVTRRNWGEYYVKSIKRTFGFGSIL